MLGSWRRLGGSCAHLGGLKPPRTNPGALGGILEVLGDVLEGLDGVSEAAGGILEALEGVLETKDSTKMGQERAKSKVPWKLQSGLKPSRRILEALGGVLEVLKVLERVLEASWRRLGGVLEVTEGVLEALGGALETKMSQDSQERAKGKIHRKLPSRLNPPGRILAVLGGILEVHKGVVEALERIFEAPGSVLEALGDVLGAKMRQDDAKMPSERAKSEILR